LVPKSWPHGANSTNMSYDNTPNRLESAFVQRETGNQYYEQVNISGSDLVIYHDSTGKLTADKVLVWASLYGIGSGGTSLSSSWASQSLSASVALTASYLIGGSDLSVSSSWASASLESQYATQSLYATQSISSSNATSASHALFSDESFTSDTVTAIAVGGGPYNIALLGSNGGVVNVYADNNGDFLYSVADKTLYVKHAETTASWATSSLSASYITASNIVGAILSASYAATASFAYFAFASQSITASYALSAGTASLVFNPNVNVDVFGNASFTNYVQVGGSLGAGKFVVTHPFGDVTILSGSITAANNITASNFLGTLRGRADSAISASWASSSISSSYSLLAGSSTGSITASYAFYAATVTGSGIIGTLAFAYSANTASLARTASFVTASNVVGRVSLAQTSSNADTASYALQAANAQTAISASYAPVTGVITNAETASVALSINFIPEVANSASWASSSISASYAASASVAYSINFVPVAATSASWVSASVFITTAQTASFITASNIRGVVSSASFATTASYASSSTFTATASLASTASYTATASLSISSSVSVSASYSSTASAIFPTVTGINQYQSAESWTNTGKTLPNALSAATCNVIGNVIYIYGGTPGTQTAGPSNLIWSSSASDPSIINASTATLPTGVSYSQLFQIGTTMYMVGGFTSTGLTSSIWTASTSAPTVWGLAGNFPIKARGMGIVQVGNTLYSFGGFDDLTYITSSFTASVSNPTVWSSAQPITFIGGASATPTMSAEGVYTLINDKIWCHGGQNAQGNSNGMSTFILTASINSPLTWGVANTVGTLVAATERIVIGNYAYILAGYPGAGGLTTTVYKCALDEASLRTGFSSNGTVGQGGYRACAAIVPSASKAYFMGGGDGFNYPAQFNQIYATTINNLGITASGASASFGGNERVQPYDYLINFLGVNALNITSSWAVAAQSMSIVANATNANFYVPFVANTGSQPVYIDTSSILYNPGTDLLTVNYISASSVTASLSGTASYAYTASNAIFAVSASSALFATSASQAEHANDADRAISASYAPVSGEVQSAVSATYAQTASLVTTSSFAYVAASALGADFANLAGEALSADFAVNAGNTLYTSSFALTCSFALNGGGGGANGTQSLYATQSLTASLLSNTGYVPSIVTQNYMVGNKQVFINGVASSSLTVTLPVNSNVYVKFTVHGTCPICGNAFFMGEYFLQKDTDAPIYQKQPGEILSQYNSNPNLNIQSLIPDIAYDTGSAAIAIQLYGTGSFTGSLVYEIRGVFTAIDQPYVPALSGSAFGDTFEAYPLGLISVLNQSATPFASPGVINQVGLGIIAAENFDAYTSGSVPALNAGMGWLGPGTIN
jgi:hypothetical protein